MSKLTPDQMTQMLADLPDWSLDEEGAALCRELMFGTFSQAFAFMTEIAFIAEKADHHPNWSNSYNKVSLALSTHSENGVTQKDFDLAHAINKLIE